MLQSGNPAPFSQGFLRSHVLVADLEKRAGFQRTKNTIIMFEVIQILCECPEKNKVTAQSNLEGRELFPEKPEEIHGIGHKISDILKDYFIGLRDGVYLN